MILPALRGIDAFPVELEGETMIGLRDPEGFVEDQLLMSQAAFVIAAFLNGQRDASAIQSELSKLFQGQVIPEADILKVVEALDNHGFLHSDKFLKIQTRIRKDFAKQTVRSAYLAGNSYPVDRVALKTFLDDQFLREGGPGKIPFVEPQMDSIRCLIAPHIDLHRGGHSYAWAYGHLSQCPCPEAVIIFGTAHSAPPVPFVLTRKDFETPFGIVSCDKKSVDRLAKSCNWDPYEYELLHRTEHSIEFQVLMLSYLFGTKCKIIPILCGSFGDNDEIGPQNESHIQSFLRECRKVLEECGRNGLVICGADLAHVGRRFGDDFEIEPQTISDVEMRDREDLEHLLAGEPDAFYKSVMSDLNQRHICSLNNMYAAVKVLPDKTSGRLLHYGYAHDPLGGIVSFATLVF